MTSDCNETSDNQTTDSGTESEGTSDDSSASKKNKPLKYSSVARKVRVRKGFVVMSNKFML